MDLLKGADRQLADLVVATAAKTDCLVHLAQVSRHLLQFADDGSFDDSYSRRCSAPAASCHRNRRNLRRRIERNRVGRYPRQEADLWGEIALDLAAIISAVPIDEWKPTSEQFEGYTGNAGNTLDRWYHRSAMVVWHRDHHFNVAASSGAASSIPLFCSMTAKLAKTPKKRLAEARADCICFARAIIAQWPRRNGGYGLSATGEKSPCDDFPERLLTLHDRDTIAAFLAKLAVQDQTLRLSSFVLAACREFGWTAFAEELRQLLALPAGRTRGVQDIPFRDVEWIADFCCDRAAAPDKAALAPRIVPLAVERFCAPRPASPTYRSPHRRRESSVLEKSFPLLVRALLAIGGDEELSRVIHFVQQSPNEFNLDDCQVPCLKSIVPWSLKRFGSVPRQLALGWSPSVKGSNRPPPGNRPVLSIGLALRA